MCSHCRPASRLPATSSLWVPTGWPASWYEPSGSRVPSMITQYGCMGRWDAFILLDITLRLCISCKTQHSESDHDEAQARDLCQVSTIACWRFLRFASHLQISMMAI